MEQKAGINSRGDSLQQVVEEAVRKALDGALNLEEERPSPRSFATQTEPYPDRKFPVEAIFPKETDHSLWWTKGINAIAANIKLKMGEGKKRAILFTSSTSGEGTTTVCSHVSLALARVYTGNVLLLDCNAQHPEIHTLFNTETAPGLTDILTERMPWADAVRKSNLKNFFILPFGPPLQEPLSLLGSEAMEGLLNNLKTDFDFLFLDAPPVLRSSEAEMILPWVEASVLIIKAHTTRREVVMRAVERLIRHKEFMGAVLNQQEFMIPKFIYQRLK